jgi:hypothetical protein
VTVTTSTSCAATNSATSAKARNPVAAAAFSALARLVLATPTIA